MNPDARKNDQSLPKEPVTSDPDLRPDNAPGRDAEIASRAYELWQRRGCPIGSDQEDWHNAEAELSRERKTASPDDRTSR